MNIPYTATRLTILLLYDCCNCSVYLLEKDVLNSTFGTSLRSFLFVTVMTVSFWLWIIQVSPRRYSGRCNFLVIFSLGEVVSKTLPDIRYAILSAVQRSIYFRMKLVVFERITIEFLFFFIKRCSKEFTIIKLRKLR